MDPGIRWSPFSSPTSTVSASTLWRSDLDAYISFSFCYHEELTHNKKHWWAEVGVSRDFCGGQHQCNLRFPWIPFTMLCSALPSTPLASNTRHLEQVLFREHCKFSKRLPSGHWPTLPAEQSWECWGIHPLLSPHLWPRSVETQPFCLWWGQLWAVLIYPPGSRCGVRLKDCPDGTLAMPFPHLCLISSRSLTGLPWEYLLNKSLAQEP